MAVITVCIKAISAGLRLSFNLFEEFSQAESSTTERFGGTNANGGKDGNIANHTNSPRFLIAGIDDQITYFSLGLVAPGGQLIIQQFCCPADLGVGQALNTKLFHNALALRIETPLIYISATAQKTVRLEFRPCSRDCGKNGAPHSSKVVGGLRYNHAQSVLRNINLFALVTIGIAQSPRNRFRMPHTKKLFSLHTHGQTEQSDKH